MRSFSLAHNCNPLLARDCTSLLAPDCLYLAPCRVRNCTSRRAAFVVVPSDVTSHRARDCTSLLARDCIWLLARDCTSRSSGDKMPPIIVGEIMTEFTYVESLPLNT